MKAMIAQEDKNPWFKTHDLEFLYHLLTAEQHREIDDVATRPTHITLKGEPVPDPGRFEGVEATLRQHRNLFFEWRYQYEDMLSGKQSKNYSFSNLQIAQWKVIGAARQRQG